MRQSPRSWRTLRAALTTLPLLTATGWLVSGCAPDEPPLPPLMDAACPNAADCSGAPTASEQVRLDTEAMLAGMAHARQHLGLQEDAAP